MGAEEMSTNVCAAVSQEAGDAVSFFSQVLTSGRWMPDAALKMLEPTRSTPYAFDLAIIAGALVMGCLAAFLARLLVVRFSCAMYARKAKMGDEVRSEIIQICTSLCWTLPVYAVVCWCWVKGMHLWIVYGIARVGGAVLAVLLTRAVLHIVNLAGLWYRGTLAAQNRPIDGILSTVKGFVWLAGAICVLSSLTHQSPVFYLSGLGAAAAVLMLVFQDSMLALAASFQVNSNKLVNIGDWIVLKDKGVDGIVEALSLHTVKIRNWDQTVVALPIRTLVDESFTNLSSMVAKGARQLKLAFLIDQRSVRFLRKTELEELKGNEVLNQCLDVKIEDVEAFRAEQASQGKSISDSRLYTNLGTFRAYVKNVLSNHPRIRQDMIVSVTTLEPTTQGVPVQVWAFTDATSYAQFSKVSAGITEHVLSVLASFQLRIFQDCSDIYQSLSEQEVIDGFRFDKVEAPE